MEDQETQATPSAGMSRIFGGFARFATGVTVEASQTVDAPAVIEQSELTVAVPTVNGVAVGEVAGVDFWVPFAQLELAPREDLLNSLYDPKEDQQFEQLKAAVDQKGDGVDSLPILPANRNIIIGGEERTLYLVYDNAPLFYALQALNRARAKVHIPQVKGPGAILLNALGNHGQMRREPSGLEECRATLRLKQYYGYTLEEIATQITRSVEDAQKPATSVVHYRCQVAQLPPAVQDLYHRKIIKWSHARMIAEAFLGDDRMCEMLATLVQQHRDMTVEMLNHIIHRIEGKHSRLIEKDGIIYEDRNLPLSLANDRKRATGSGGPEIGVFGPMVARPAAVQRAATHYHVSIIGADNPDKVAVTPSTFNELVDWLGNRRNNTPIKEVEVELLGFLTAIRNTARAQGMINQQGVLTPMVDASLASTAKEG